MIPSKYKLAIRLALAALVTASSASAQILPHVDATTNPRQTWTASWISHPTAPLREPLTLHFRKSFQLSAPPKHFLIHVSADNRFILYLNGHRVGDGPARGDLAHWRYETYDLAPLLLPGANTISATVWNFGVYGPQSQFTDRTALLVQGDTSAEADVNTDAKWRVEIEPGHIAYPRQAKGFWLFMAVGPGEQLRAADYDWNWQTEDTESGAWVPAGLALRESIYAGDSRAESRDAGGHNSWQLVPDSLPAMIYTPESAGKIVRSELPGADAFPAQPVTVPAHSQVHLLLDRGSLTTAYPQLAFAGGKGSKVEVTYSEALYDEKQKKGDRDEVGTRKALGASDLVFPDGGANRIFEPMWWRTWRYLDLNVTTADEPLDLTGLAAQYTAYPFEQKAHFTSSDPELDAIWKIGWHTLEIGAHETYMDAPYYEQLQYVGDTRIEALLTYAVTADDRLPKQAIQAFYDSRRADGLTMSRYPSALAQYIPPFSLLWIGMLHDFAATRPDTAFVQQILPGTRTVLTWFAAYQRPDGLLGNLPDWSFVDWTAHGVKLPTYDAKGESCLLTLEYLGALDQAAQMETLYGDPALATVYKTRHAAASKGVLTACWNPTTRMMADSPARDVYSQHGNTLAVLYDVVPKAQQTDLMNRTLADATSPHPTLIPATYYFDFYIARALEHAGMGDAYFGLLDQWRALLKLHFTTWPEIPENTRSDSHAWSADPTLDLLRIVAGISSASQGFATVRIAPHLGTLTTLDAAMPHPRGIIHVNYAVNDKKLQAVIDLPAALSGTFVWKGHTVPLHPGANTVTLSQ